MTGINDRPIRLWPGRLLRLAVAPVAILLAAGAPAHAQDVLAPGEAFRVEAQMIGAGTLAVSWRIAEDHYMYRKAFSVSAPGGGVVLGDPVFPAGKKKRDEFFGEVEIYDSDVSFTVPVTPVADGLNEFVVQAVGQGCNEPLGVCYPPVSHTASVDLAAAQSSAGQSLMSEAGEQRAVVDSLKALFQDEPGQQEFLHPDEAFRFELTSMAGEALLARFSIEPGYYLYKDKFSVESLSPGVEVGAIQMPEGVRKTDEYFGDIVAFYDGFDAQVALERDAPSAQSASFKLTYQGCAEDGICYPPIEKTVSLRLPGVSDAAADSGFDAPAAGATGLRSFLWPVLLAFGSGVLLTFTPCVLPMVPILAGIIVGQGSRVTRLRGGGLASVYVLGTAVTYTAVGIVAGLTGDQLQAYFQNIWAIGLIAALMVVMALSMFGFYELKMPSGIQTRLQHRATGLKAGAVGGVFLMGILSALIVGACVSPILISILGLAINRGDPALGGVIMFAMALGMGLFLIAMGFGFGYVLPRSGPWMERVKHVFGLLLLAVAVYLLGAIPEVPVLYLWAALFVGAAVYLGVQAGGSEALGWRIAGQVGALALAAWAVLAVLGGIQGNRDVLKPVDHRALLDEANVQSAVHAEFRKVATPGELARLMKSAQADGKPVMVDYYADWCVDCVRMEKTTFTVPEVARTLNEQFMLVQVDVTDPNDPGTRAIKQSHGVFGPPAMLFFDRQGEEIRSMRRYGYMNDKEFMRHIEPLNKDS